ncbi:MAG: hypothetical protein ACFWTM_06815 [Mitsuokella multacida]
MNAINDIWALIGTNILFIAVLQPLALLHFLPFRRFLSTKQQKKITVIWGILLILEVGTFTLVLMNKPFSSLAAAYLSGEKTAYRYAAAVRPQ